MVIGHLITSATKESREEAKVVKEVFAVTQQLEDELDQLLIKHNMWKTIRICVWISRFLYNSKRSRASNSKRSNVHTRQRAAGA